MSRFTIKFNYKYMILFIVFILIIISIVYDPLNLMKPTIKQYEVPFFIEHKDTYSPRSVSNVPLVIYESWHSNTVPEKMKENIYKLLKMNPQFDYYLYSDEACLQFIKENFDQDVMNAFNILKPGAYKSDLWRYCILYKKGGMYLDIKYYSLVPLVNIIKENPLIFVRDIPKACRVKMDGIYNAFMVSAPNNNIFKICIDDIVNSCKNRLYKHSPLDITGPCLLGEVVKKQNSNNYIDNLKFAVKDLYGIHIIFYNNIEILKIYSEYRKEQKYFQKTFHYGTLWSFGLVYN